MEAAHFHVFAAENGHAIVRHARVAAPGDGVCLLCWAQQAAQNGPWVASGALCALAAHCGASPAPSFPATAPRRLPSPPRAPPLT